MNKVFTFFIASNTGSRIRKFTISGFFLFFLIATIGTCLIYSGFVVKDYYKLKQKQVDSDTLQKKVINQQNEIVDQREQIRLFADEINNFKSQLVALNTFENKIRMIANIENNSGRSNVFGIGGTIPENLDANFKISNSHSSLMREMHEQIDQLTIFTESQGKGFESLFDSLDKKKNILASTPAIWPTTGWVTSTFGYRKSPFTGLREFHKGLDISTRIGTPIIAPADGTITFCGKRGYMGKAIIIDHGHGMVTRFGHVSKFLKKQGEAVKRGDTIAQVGNTGRSTGPHLHYDIRLNGISVNPEKYILN
ncbi:MAG: M23 family metallopeptidase [Deltaproteobacteria bacterium]|nr:M23 family metallopeptidase [Deltaproteobacteria bacterium]MBW2219234.1 M23 family metallopeptidase [Deltaproteobacteria bacterium]